MKTETRKWSKPWLPCVALASCLLLLPSSAGAQNPGTDPYFINKLLKSNLKACSTWMGYIGQVGSAVSYGEKLAQFLGLMSSPVTPDQILAEMQLIAAYQDRQQKQEVLNNANEPIYQLDQDFQYYKDAIENGTLNPIQLANFQELSNQAISRAISPDLQCTTLTQFQTLTLNKSSPQSYEWRPAMQAALTAIAHRLLALDAMDKTNKGDFRNDPVNYKQMDDIRACLKQHRDMIQPPRPFAYCSLNTNCVLACQEPRSWPQWTVHKSTLPFLPGCITPSTNSASETKFTDLEDITASKIDHDDLGSVVFSLQRMIDTLYVITHPGDLAQNDPHIRFATSPQFCLSLNSSGSLILDSCSATNATWTYSRKTGRIKNISANKCINAPGFPPTTIQMVTCTESDADDYEGQVWSWNPETGIIKNSFGSVLAVTDASPKAASSVSAQPENAWHLNQQVWTSKVTSTCIGAICPVTGPAAWNQGAITTGSGGASTTLRYPVDFNIFAYEEASGFQDVGGPVAAAGRVSTVSFSINYQNYQTLPVALVVGYGPVELLNGSIYGTPFIPLGQFLPMTVTVHGPPEYEAPINENPISFEMAFLNLQAWSKSLASLSSPTSAASFLGDPRGGTFWLRTRPAPGGNPNLEIFNINGSDVSNIRTLLFQWVGAPTILINVTGSNVSFSNFRVTGLSPGQNILWNFPQAVTLKMTSLGFVGSVLAPSTYVNLNYGSVQGTMVAWKAFTNMEFYSYPLTTYQVVKGP